MILTWWEAKKWEWSLWFKDPHRFLIERKCPFANVADIYTLLVGILVTTHEISHWAFRKLPPMRKSNNVFGKFLSSGNYPSTIARGTTILSAIFIRVKDFSNCQHVMNAISWNTPFTHILTQMIA